MPILHPGVTAVTRAGVVRQEGVRGRGRQWDVAGVLLPQRRGVSPALLVAALAAVVRLGLVLASRGGPGGSFGYDASVYYAASDALLHGRLPYRDFVLLHPPGLGLALTPFAAVGQLLGDHAGFELGNTCFALLASANAGLVVVLARRLGVPSRAALVGGLFSAVWFGAVQAEISARLEPLGSALLLSGLLLVLPEPVTRRRLVLGGALLGAAVTVKIWWIVPVALVLAWQLARRRRAALPVLLGAATAAVAVMGPFLLAAPGQMLRMVVTDQLGRPTAGYSRVHRLGDLATVHQAFPRLPGPVLLVLLVLTALLLLAVVTAAMAAERGRLPASLLLVQLVVLLVAPTYFSFYSGYLAVSLALTVALAAGAPGRWTRVGRAGAVGLVAGAVVLTCLAGLVRSPTFTAPVAGAGTLRQAVAGVPCVVSDSPMLLIELDALSRGLSHPDCPNWVDATGRTYDLDAPPDGHDEDRRNNPVWQAHLRTYLLSGDAVVLFRGATGADEGTLAAIRRHPVLVGAGHLTIYRVR